MKKFFAVILLFIYAAASSGATVSFHYCMGKFTGWDVSSTASHVCSNCGMSKENKKGCCNDEQTSFKLQKEQLASTINDVPSNAFVYLDNQHSLIQKPLSFFCNDDISSSHSPPLIPAVSSLILNCVFRI